MSAPACHQERTAMPITPYLNGQQFDPETKRILGLAFEMTCTALRIGECDDGVKQAIADKIIDLAKSGGRNPDVAFVCKIAKLNTKSPLRGRGAQKSGNFRRRPRGY